MNWKKYCVFRVSIDDPGLEFYGAEIVMLGPNEFSWKIFGKEWMSLAGGWVSSLDEAKEAVRKTLLNDGWTDPSEVK